MNDLKKIYKSQAFQINSNVLKTIKNLDINLKEFLLILYFINVEETLNLENIKNVIGLNDEEILTSYSNLLTKGLIETKVLKENGKVNEVISLDMFYDKLILSSKEEKVNNTDIYSKFESEFGRSISPIEYETINKWIENGVNEEMIESALKEAVINGVCNLRYVDKIIYEWTKKGKEPRGNEYNELMDYDWLNEYDE